jgi:hypothetical protein
MLRALAALILVTCIVSQAYTEDAIPSLNWNWFTTTAPQAQHTLPPKKPLVIQVQEPYCELGAGACGGMCLEESGKRWECPSGAIPCYHRGQHCTCEVASMCWEKKKQ